MPSNFFIRCDGKYIRINTMDIRYLESLKNYVRIITTTSGDDQALKIADYCTNRLTHMRSIPVLLLAEHQLPRDAWDECFKKDKRCQVSGL